MIIWIVPIIFGSLAVILGIVLGAQRFDEALRNARLRKQRAEAYARVHDRNHGE